MKRNVTPRKLSFLTKLFTTAVLVSMMTGSATAFAANASSLAASYVSSDYSTENIIDGSGYSVYLDGSEVTDQFTGDSAIKATTEGRTLLPIRALGNLLGCSVDWDSAKKVAILSLNGTTLEVPIGSGYLVVDNEAEKIDSEGTKAVIYNERTYLPFRSVCENFGFSVSYDSATKSIYITSSGSTGTVTPTEKPSTVTGDEALAAIGLYTAIDLGYDANNGPNPGEDYYDSWNNTVTIMRNDGLTDAQINQNLQYVYLCKDTSDQISINHQYHQVEQNTSKVDEPTWDGTYEGEQYYYWQWTGMRWITAYKEYSGIIGHSVSMS